MKKLIFKHELESALLKAIWGALLLALMPVSAQIQNKETVFIGDMGSVYLSSGTYFFGSSGQTKTSRTLNSYGKLIFNSGVLVDGVSDSHYVDGYVQALGTSSFIFPIGQSGIYAPAQVIPVTANGVNGAYYRSSANTVGSTLDSAISSVSDVEYWDISGQSSARISLTWRDSSLMSNLVTTMDDLTIVGFDGAKWVLIDSTVDSLNILGGVSTLSSGSITTVNDVNLADYTAFSIGSISNSCAPLIAGSGNSKIWDGVIWAPSAPTLNDVAIINDAYSGSLSCNSLVLNADVTVSNGQSVEIVNGVSGSGKIILASEAGLIQRNGLSDAPNIELNKHSRMMKRYDYIYWGTPIKENFISQLDNAKAVSANQAGVFDLKFGYTSGVGGGWNVLNSISSGKGFITRIKNQAPFVDAVSSDIIEMKFSGIANNGDIVTNVVNNPSSLNGGTSFALLANPYPSAVDAYKFLNENSNLDGALYFWTAATAPSSLTGLYSQADYAAWNLSGMVSPSPIGLNFDGKIASGQGFMVKVLSNGTATFTNCMRSISGNSIFYRKTNKSTVTSPINRFKLNMTGDNGVFSQILIAYIPEATYDNDRLYDAARNSVSTARLYSILNGYEMAINGRPTFEETDIVPLGVSKTTISSEKFSFSIHDLEGIFGSVVKVFLHDKQTNIYHDLSLGDYETTIDGSKVTNRFEIVYRSSDSLSTNDFSSLDTLALLNNNILSITSSDSISSIAVFDIGGRLIDQFEADSKVIAKPFYHPKAVYIVKIKLENGMTVSKKIINYSVK